MRNGPRNMKMSTLQIGQICQIGRFSLARQNSPPQNCLLSIHFYLFFWFWNAQTYYLLPLSGNMVYISPFFLSGIMVYISRLQYALCRKIVIHWRSERHFLFYGRYNYETIKKESRDLLFSLFAPQFSRKPRKFHWEICILRGAPFPPPPRSALALNPDASVLPLPIPLKIFPKSRTVRPQRVASNFPLKLKIFDLLPLRLLETPNPQLLSVGVLDLADLHEPIHFYLTHPPSLIPLFFWNVYHISGQREYLNCGSPLRDHGAYPNCGRPAGVDERNTRGADGGCGNHLEKYPNWGSSLRDHEWK